MLNLIQEKKLDVIFASRLKNKKTLLDLLSAVFKKPSYLATLLCTFLINFFYNKKYTDIIGTKLYKKETVKNILPKVSGPGFDFELISLISKRNLSTEEIFIDYTPRKNSSEKKIKFYHLINALYGIFKIKFFEK
tara:strand:+ start:148 stop:552 length:405 start_codon:yes stop_codon:yes gene_type:complete